MTPTETQAAAIRSIVAWYRDRKGPQEFYLAGYAGVGKSTVAKMAIDELREKCRVKKVRTGAYTGKAAHVLRKKGVENPSTIHGMIYRLVEGEGEPRFELDPVGAAADCDLIVLDEVSMVDEAIANDVRSFGKKILVMGDPGQLPPVRGAGAFTSRAPDFFLSEIHRQAADSPIIRIATMARQGETIPAGRYSEEVEVLPLDRASQERVYDSRTQAICGIHRVRWTISQRARKRLGFDGPLPAQGERVMCCRNNRQIGLFNGMLGTTTAEAKVEEDGLVTLSAALEDRAEPLNDAAVHPYLFAQHFSGPSSRPRIEKGVEEFDWAYAITCHKAQGSEWPHVTVVDDSASFREDRWRWLYTAITRASSGLTLLQRTA